MQAALDRLWGFLERHRRLVLAAWVLLLLAAAPFAAKQTEHLTSGGFQVPGSQSETVDRNLERFDGAQREVSWGELQDLANQAAHVLRERGATAVYACATHGVFAMDALPGLLRAPVERWIVTDTVPPPAEDGADALQVLSVAPLLAESIERIHDNRSVSGLFD